MASEDQSPRSVARLTGKVVAGSLGKGSKSEREAIWIETDEGRFVLRRKDGPSFGDSGLSKYVGKSVECSGFITGYTLLAEKIRVLPGSD